MECATCGAALSAFDVHCRACGASVVPPDLDAQLAGLGSELANNPNSGEDVVYIPTKLNGDKLGTVQRLAGAGVDAIWDVARIVAGGDLEQQVQREWSIERAIRRSPR